MSKLEKLTNLSIILVCLVLTGDFAYRRISAGAPIPTAKKLPAAKPAYAVGTPFPTLTNFRPEAGKRSLVLVVRDGCKFCDASMPFYQRLAIMIKRTPGTEMVGVCLNPADVCANYFGKNGVPVTRSVTAGTDKLKISGTPTLVLVDEQGRVDSVWVGQLPDVREQEVVSALVGRMEPR